METSLRYGGDSKSLRIHAKEKFPISSNTLCQLDGELDTRIGAPTYVNAMIRYFYPDLSASLGVGVQVNRNQIFDQKKKVIRNQKFHYNVRGKKSFQITTNGFANFKVKGRCTVDEEFRKVNYNGGAEFVWNIFNVKKDQDLRVKFGYDVFDKIPYLRIQENNWTFHTDGNRRWNVRYDL